MPMDAFYGKIFGAMPKSSFAASTPAGTVTGGGPGDKLTLRRGQVVCSPNTWFNLASA